MRRLRSFGVGGIDSATRLIAQVALRTGIAPSELEAYPFVFDAMVDELREQDEDDAHDARRGKLRSLFK